jgi:subtilisin family serine protease
MEKQQQIIYTQLLNDSIMSVAAIDDNAVVASWWQQNDQVEIAAPGVSVLSTVPVTCDIDGNYEYLSDTSMAAPHVSAVVALAWSHNATKIASEVLAVLQSTALGAPGRDNAYGYGLVQAATACLTLTGSSCTPSDPEPASSGPSSAPSFVKSKWTRI